MVFVRIFTFTSPHKVPLKLLRFWGGRFQIPAHWQDMCFADSVVPLSKAFGCSTGKHVCSDALGAHPGVNSPERRVYLSPLLCLPSSRDKLSKAVSLLGEDREEERKRRGEIDTGIICQNIRPTDTF